jgi:6-methylsalicylate decarboxylase
MARANRIHTHQHYIPPRYANWLAGQGVRPGGIDLPPWSRETALNMMDQHDIQTGVLSLSTPGVTLGDVADARSKAREVNMNRGTAETLFPRLA